MKKFNEQNVHYVKQKSSLWPAACKSKKYKMQINELILYLNLSNVFESDKETQHENRQNVIAESEQVYSN